MKKSMVIVFNHSLTQAQEEDALRSLDVSRLIKLPEDLQKIWSFIPAAEETIDEYLAPLKNWLKNISSKGDYVLIQGDFGAVYLMVQYCVEIDRIPVYSTTCRDASEELLENGSVQLIHRFRHVRFRRYGV